MVQIVVSWIFIALLLLGGAGSLDQPNAWLFMGLLLAVDLTSLLFVLLEVLAERGSKKENAENGDKILGKLIPPSMLGLFLIAALDYRWH